MSQPPVEDESPVIPGWADAPITGDRVDVSTEPIVVGDPGGGRIEIRDTGFHAFDASGAETAHIDGQEGVFVGGSFRTSDTLPGQVTLSDTANVGTPGISIEPEDSTGYDVLPSIGPGNAEMHIFGGVSTDDTTAGAIFRADGTSIYYNGPGETGTGAWAEVNGGEASLTYRPDRTSADEAIVLARGSGAVVAHTSPEDGFSIISSSAAGAWVDYEPPGATDGAIASVRSTPDSAQILYQDPDGVNRRLRVDESGVWVDTETAPHSGTYTSYNLELTAQDSGWQTITLNTGITGAGSPAWRNKGGVIYMRGTLTADWTEGWNDVATGLPAVMTPDVRVVRNAPSASQQGLLFRMEVDGRLRFYKPTAGSIQGDLSGVFYPVD